MAEDYGFGAVPTVVAGPGPRRTKWPEHFPDVVGMTFITANNERWGNGLGVNKSEMYDYEEHPTDPAVFRMKFRVVRVSRPADASSALRAMVGKREVSWRFFRADRSRGCFELLGGIDLPDESEVHSSWGKAGDLKRDVMIGDWRFRNDKAFSLQYAFNDDFTVLRAANPVNPDGTRRTDFTNVLIFFFARPAGAGDEVLCPDMVPVVDDAEANCKQLDDLFADGNIFRDPSDTSLLQVKVTGNLTTLTRIETLADQFGVMAHVSFAFPITKTDVADFVGGGDPASWLPVTWPGFELEVANPAVGRDAAPATVRPGPFTIDRLDSGEMIARHTLHITGDLYEEFGLENYPFDSQSLRLTLQSVGIVATNLCAFTVDQPSKIIDPQCSEWSSQVAARITCHVATDKGGAEAAGRVEFTLAAQVDRASRVHVFRVIAVLGIFAVAALLAFSLEGIEGRFSNIVTLMLTATAYSIVISGDLPKLGYLTFLELYIMFVFGFLGVLLLECVVIDRAGLSSQADGYVLYSNCGALVLIHLLLAAHVKFKLLPREAGKHSDKTLTSPLEPIDQPSTHHLNSFFS